MKQLARKFMLSGYLIAILCAIELFSLQQHSLATDTPEMAAVTIKLLHQFVLESRATHLTWINDYLAVVLWDKPNILVLDTTTGKVVYTIQSGITDILDFEFAVDEMVGCANEDLLVISYRTQPTLQIWRLSANEAAQYLSINYKKRGVYFSLHPDCKQIAVVDYGGDDTADNEINIWDISKGQILKTTNIIDNWKTVDLDGEWQLAKMLWSPDGKYIATTMGAMDAHVAIPQIRDSNTWAIVEKMPQSANEDIGDVNIPFMWSDDSQHLLGATVDPGGFYRLWIWDIASNKLSYPFQRAAIQNSEDFPIWILDKRLIIAGNISAEQRKSIAVYDIANGKIVESLELESDGFYPASLDSTGHMLAIADSETLKIYHMQYE